MSLTERDIGKFCLWDNLQDGDLFLTTGSTFDGSKSLLLKGYVGMKLSGTHAYAWLDGEYEQDDWELAEKDGTERFIYLGRLMSTARVRNLKNEGFDVDRIIEEAENVS